MADDNTPPVKNECHLTRNVTTVQDTRIDVITLKGDATAKELLELAKDYLKASK
ncbi:MAG: hypothetical protein KAV87_19455 [Desulfobacteraceae bacterium]|nr:hypothetical protein [Desulfobacteraceae bacterium]